MIHEQSKRSGLREDNPRCNAPECEGMQLATGVRCVSILKNIERAEQKKKAEAKRDPEGNLPHGLLLQF